jgi:glycosyltransferase involved in cell wall biosynthesis
MPTPTVSVIVPCYNLGDYIEETMESVQAQTFTDYEVLVVDDGSSDERTCELLARASWPRTRVFRTDNKGLAAARNFLIARSSGEYLCALDADDKLHPQFLERTVDLLRTRPEIAFVSTRLQMFGLEDQIWPSTLRCDLPTLLGEDTVITAALVRRSAVLDVGGYDPEMPAQGDEDWDLWISLLEAGYSGITLPEVLFYYRRRERSMCGDCTRGQTHLDLVRYLFRKHRASFERHMLDVLLAKEAEISDLRVANVRAERGLATQLQPQIEARRAELRRLTAAIDVATADRLKAQAARDNIQELKAEQSQLARALEAQRAEYMRARMEVSALRASVSWRLTAPLRHAYDWVRRLSGSQT